MVCRRLAGLVAHPPPPGTLLRFYRPGDESAWSRIHLDAEPYHAITSDLFCSSFGVDEEKLRHRQLYACTQDGLVVGTATAWFDDDYHGESWGRLHWVAVIRAFQGRGIGQALASAACHRMLTLGHNRAYLTTHSVRVRAIRFYLHLGFQPDIRTEADARVWQSVLRTTAVSTDVQMLHSHSPKQ